MIGEGCKHHHEDPLRAAEQLAAALKTGDKGIDTLAEIVRLMNSLSEGERQAFAV